MRLEIGNWTLEKAQDSTNDDKTISIRMIANKLEFDKENQQILPQAFSKACVDEFLKYGIIDWHHTSVTGKTPEQRSQAIIGKPYDFKWENNLPIVYGRLTKAHPIVRDSILPHLEAGQNVFAASVGGNIKKAKRVIDNTMPKDQILEIAWDHIAIAASPYVVSAGSTVSMVKAFGQNNSVKNDLFIQYSDVNAFESEYNLVLRGDEILKALEMGSGTDMALLTGADAMRKQSLEGDKYIELVNGVAMGLRANSIGASKEGIKLYLKSNGLTDNEIETFLQKFNKTMQGVLN